MKRRVPLPNASDGFLVRVCAALDMKPIELAHALDMPYADIHQMMGVKATIPDIDKDETWWQIAEYMDLQIGLLMAARQELNVALQQQRAMRALRHAKHMARDKKRSPRS